MSTIKVNRIENTATTDGGINIDSNGKIGVGTASPTETLTLNTSSGASIGFEHNGTEIATINNNAAALYVHAGSGKLLSLGANGSEAMRIDSSGRVGVGTSAPYNVLTGKSLSIGNGVGAAEVNFLSATDGYGSIYFGDGTSGNATYRGYLEYVHADDSMRFGVAASERMRIDSSGRVGIGTSSPASFLHVDSGNTFGSVVLSRDGGVSGRRPFGIGISGSADDHLRITASSDTTGANAFANQIIEITSEGKVGIGTDSPGQQLTIKKTGGQTQVSLISDTNESGAIYFGDTDSTNRGVVLYDQGQDSLQFSTAGSEKMRITSGGNVGIGDTSPGGRLDIGFNSSSVVGLVLSNAGTGTSARFYSGSSIVGSITVTGSATAFNTSSDYRLKENVVGITDGITRVKQLSPSRFNFIADDTTTVDGFIAHEAQTVVPEAVTGEKDGEEMQGIDQSKLVPLLTAALQEAISKIETLETQHASLLARVTALEAA